MPFVTAPNNEEDMKASREASWLCRLFQEHALTAKEKSIVLRSLMNEHKKKRKTYG